MDEYPEWNDFSEASTVIEEHAFSLLVETFLFALYAILIANLICHPCVTRKTTSLPRFMLPFTLSMFALFSLYWALDIYLLWAEYHTLLSPKSDGSYGPDLHAIQRKGTSAADEDVLAPRYFATVYAQYIMQLTLIALGDFVSLWRAYVIFGKPKWLYILTICIAVAESVIYILVFASSSTEYLIPSTQVFVYALANTRAPLVFIGYSTTGLSQLGSTSLIAFKAWVHWKEVREFVQRSARHRSLTALTILIESGIAYLALLIWYGAISYWGPTESLAVYTCRFYSVPLVAMYPTLVIVIVASRRSVLERSIASPVHVRDMQSAISLADRRGYICRARRIIRRTRSFPDKSFSETDDIIWPEVGLGRSMGLTSIVTVPKNDDQPQSCDEGMVCSSVPSSATVEGC
ncbi:hypothetical protein PENSPDRAFT_648914 [Peniophora sp. CONT]|nr:hypothetical protein PENSPDRAFT_648914 [Peniophora sp. CONT]